ncbi:MAG: hypothetical protein ACI9US_003065 [Gammaproteobacteria bacterium]|jgi:hypothetical protein
MKPEPLAEFSAFVGIDWADKNMIYVFVPMSLVSLFFLYCPIKSKTSIHGRSIYTRSFQALLPLL